MESAHGITPIHCGADNGHIEIVKILASLTDNLNASDGDGNPTTPNKKGEKL